MKKWMAIVLAVAMLGVLTACGGKEETTITGIVLAVDGSVISLMEMESGNMDIEAGERPEMPEGMEGMEGFQGFGDFNPEDFAGSVPDGENFPQWGDGEMPEMPEGMTMPAEGQMPGFSGEFGGMPVLGNFASDAQTKSVDVANAHISVEIEGGKESGSMADIQPGTFVTITMSGKGEATYVLVSRQSFGGRFAK